MLGLAPNIPAGSEVGVFALLTLLADPVASKARLDEMLAAAADAEAKTAALADLAKGVDMRQSLMVDREAAVVLREDAVAILERTVNETQIGLSANAKAATEAQDDRQRAQAAREALQNQVQEDQDERAEELAAREMDVTERETKADALKVKYEAALAQLQAIATGG